MFDDRDLFYSRLKSQKEASQSKVAPPFFCDLLISEQCNLQCKTCFFWKHGLKDELSLQECKQFVSSLKGFVKPPFEISLGGGEPLLKPGILELVRHCVACGLEPTISTNATLIDDALAQELARSGLHRLSLSLKSLNEDTHDYLTGVKGSYKRFMEAVAHLKKHWKTGDMNIHVTLQEQNIHEILDIASWVNQDPFFTGISFQALAQPFRTDLVERWYEEGEHSYLWPKDPHQVSRILDNLISRKLSGWRILNPVSQLVIYKRYYREPAAFARIHHCNFGDYIFNVNVLGLVHLCCFMDPIGNITHTPLAELWHSSQATTTRARMHDCQKSCNNIVNCFFQEEGDEIPGEVT